MSKTVRRTSLPRAKWSSLSKEPAHVQDKIKSTFSAVGIHCSPAAAMNATWGRVERLLPLFSTRNEMLKVWTKGEWANFGAPLIDDSAYDKLFVGAIGDPKMISTGVAGALAIAFPDHDRKFIDRIADMLYMSGEHSESSLFHFFALNEFLIDANGSDTTFGEYLEDVVRFNAIHANMRALNMRQGDHTNDLLSRSSSGDRQQLFPFWCQGVNGTKSRLLGFTVDNYLTLMADKELSRLVPPYDVLSVVGRALSLIKNPNEGEGAITVKDMETTAFTLLRGLTDKANTSDAVSPLLALSFVTSELNGLIGRTNARGLTGKRKYGTRAVDLRTVLDFLSRNIDQFGFDDVIGIIGAICVPSSFTRDMSAASALKLMVSVIEEYDVSRAVNFLRLTSRILLTRNGERPNESGWADYLKDGTLLDVDGDLSVGMIVSLDGDNSPSRMRSFWNWRKLFH